MILTPHIIAGAALATQINNPILLAISALTLHHFLDVTPHWDYDIYRSKKKTAIKVGIDIVVASIIILYLVWDLRLEKQISIILGGFFGVLPDGLLFINIISGRKLFVRFVKFHDFWHHLIIKKDKKPPLVLGLATQIIALTISFIVLGIFR